MHQQSTTLQGDDCLPFDSPSYNSHGLLKMTSAPDAKDDIHSYSAKTHIIDSSSAHNVPTAIDAVSEHRRGRVHDADHARLLGGHAVQVAVQFSRA